MKTIAAVLTELKKPLKIQELIIPELKPGQVIVKMAFSGVCRSQLNEAQGLKGEDKFLPHTLGHEGSGIVEVVGPAVKKVKPGDHVVLTWIKGMGADVPSTQYKRADGSIVNSGAISTFLTKTVISENCLVKINKKMTLCEAALLGCAIPTGAGIIINTAKVTSGSSVAVFGVGGIGLSALIASKLNNASIIIAVDIHDFKLKLAKEFGATHILNASNNDILFEIRNITGGKGVDYTIEASGNRMSMELAFQSVRDSGGLCILAGNLPKGEKITIEPFDLIKGKRIIGTWGGDTNPDKDIPMYVDFYLSGILKLDKMLTHRFKLEEINTAFDIMGKGEAGRIIIEF